jgi:hypothetical protein
VAHGNQTSESEMMFRVVRASVLAFTAAILVGVTPGASPSRAQIPGIESVRGVVVSFDGSLLVVGTRQGTNVSVKLADNLRVTTVVKASLADIKPGVYIGTSSVPKEGSTSRALEIHILPEAMRGAGEGDFPWDLAPGSSMTNGTVGNPVEGVEGTTVTVGYKGGERKVTIQPDTAIVTYGPADQSDIKSGTPVFVFARKQSDGSLSAGSVTVGKNGVAPPM